MTTQTTKRNKSKTPKQQKAPTNKTQKQQPNKTRNQPHKPKSDVTDSSSWVNGLINARGDNFVSSQLVLQSNKQTKNNQTTRPYQRVSEATKYHAETRDPPARIPEITWHRPSRHNDSAKRNSKQTPATPGRSESGETQNRVRRWVKKELR